MTFLACAMATRYRAERLASIFPACGHELIILLGYPAFLSPNWHWQWCLCVLRWKEAFDAGIAPPVVLESTHANALQFVTLEQLMQHRAPSDEPSPSGPSKTEL